MADTSLRPHQLWDSPYQSFSTFAGNPYFIDPEELIERGWISKERCSAFDFGGDEESIDYGKIYETGFRCLGRPMKIVK